MILNMKKSYLFLAAMAALSQFMYGQTSPNGKVKVEQNGQNLEVSYKKGEAWQKVLTLDAGAASKSQMSLGKAAYEMLVGKKSECSNEYYECTYTRTADGKPVTVRVYNDGVAWTGLPAYNVNIAAAKNNWLQRWTEAYEEFFPKNREQKEGARWAYPALFEYDNDVFALLTESCITADNAASSLYSVDGKNYSIRAEVASNRGVYENRIGGWQTLIVGGLSDVVESTLVTDNSESRKLSDVSWIKPGVASWVYWAYNHGSNDYDIIKKYTDMAVELKLPYVLIDAEWDGMKNGKTIEDAVKYAVDNGVKPIIWYNSSVGWVDGAPTPKFLLNKAEDREKAFAWCEKIGVSGVKIDFFSGDNNLNMNYMIELMECAAKHHLLVNFHGATLPRGWQRTYPNLVSTEGVYGAEWYNNVPTFTKKAAAHNATLPFTRNVVGSMDYTPCAFTDSQHPHITTHAHELALTALFESGIQHLADRPESFLAQPQDVKDYLSNLPTAWDETRLLSGYPGESAVMARRKGDVWYIAGINGRDEAQTLSFDVSTLSRMGKTVVVFEDSGKPAKPWKISKRKAVPSSVTCLARGGFVMVVK